MLHLISVNLTVGMLDVIEVFYSQNWDTLYIKYDTE